MVRDSLFGERIFWQGRCRSTGVPSVPKVLAIVASVVSAVTICYAVVAAESLEVPVGGMILFAGWCATIALGAWRIPLWWRSGLEYLVTERHVIWRRGRIRRSIETKQISYALVRWDAADPALGDLVLVRAVPTGALRRTLSLTLYGVESPDRLWATVRGVEPSAPLGNGERPLAQRLDPGERVLWSAGQHGSPWTSRRVGTAVVGAALALTFVRSLARLVPNLVQVLKLHALSPTLAALLVAGGALGMLLLLAGSAAGGYAAFVRPARLARSTRYFVTNARVLIRRGNEELSLDRSNIAYVIDAPYKKLHDVFLVIDGPQARALAPSGAFGGEDRDDALRPVLAAIDDADTVGRILRAREIELEKRAA
ncbi:MAG TPA: hypothetical protein VKU41_10390 [Polyangiaceae bacterium]|nr:hypothetical protein [Polyangiaceae bacterium]